MSWRSVLRGVARVGLPIVGSMVPGLGTMAGAALGGAIGGAVGSGRPRLGNIATGAISGAAGGAALRGVGNIANAVRGGGAAGALRGVGSIANTARSGGAMGALRSIGSAALNNSDLLMGGLSMLQGQRQQNRADDMQQRALRMAEQRYADFAPIRTLGLQGMQNTQRRDLSGVYRNPQNPFA